MRCRQGTEAFRRTMCAALGVVALMAGTAQVYADAVTLRYAHLGPNRGVQGSNIEWLKNEIESRTNGEVQLEIHWGGSLAAAADVVSAVGAGLADMGTIVSSYTPGLFELYEIGNQLTGTSNMWVAQQAIYELATENEDVKRQFSNSNIQYIANLSSGLVQLICKRPISSIEDIRNLKIRTGGPYTQVFDRLGAVTLAIPQPDVYQALDTGVVDCNQIYHITIEAYRQYEVAQHVIELDYGLVMAYAIIMNKDVWEELTDEQRTIIRQVGDDYNEYIVRTQVEEAEAVKGRLAAGVDNFKVTYTKAPVDVMEAITREGKVVAVEWMDSVRAKGLNIDGVNAHYEAALAKYQAEFDQNGYPWQ